MWAVEVLRVEGAAQSVRGQEVHPSVPHERRCGDDRVEHALHARPQALRRSAAATSRSRARRAGEIEEMCTLGFVELQGAGERLEDRLRDAGAVAAFEAGVVVDADAGKQRDLLTAQSGDAAVACRTGQARLLGRDPGPARGQELADLAPWCPRAAALPRSARR